MSVCGGVARLALTKIANPIWPNHKVDYKQKAYVFLRAHVVIVSPFVIVCKCIPPNSNITTLHYYKASVLVNATETMYVRRWMVGIL